MDHRGHRSDVRRPLGGDGDSHGTQKHSLKHGIPELIRIPDRSSRHFGVHWIKDQAPPI